MNNLQRVLSGTVLFLIGLPVAAQNAAGQNAAEQPPTAFEVVSIKAINPASGGRVGAEAVAALGGGCDGGFPKVDAGRFVVTTTPYALITWAYGYNKHWGCSYVSLGDLLTGGPAWIRSERFEVQGVIPKGATPYTLQEFMDGNAPGLETMIRTMLMERFKLAVHREIKDVPALALVLGKGTPKLTPSKEGDKPGMGIRRQVDPNGQVSNKLQATKVGIRDLVFLLGLQMHRLVVDQTGLTGEYNFNLEFAPLDAALTDSSGPSIFTAVQEQLGLKLESTKTPIEGVVIDRAERPSDN